MTKTVFISLFILFVSFAYSQENADKRIQYFPKSEEKVSKMPKKKNVWVFIMAGQSNMAGRGQVEPQDTIYNKRILSINAKGELIIAKEPLHFYEPTLTGLDCGMSFAKSLLPKISKNITILLIPTAVGGSAVQQWIGDSTYRKVQLLSNFKEKVNIGLQYGTIKALLWHQGESNTNNKENINLHTSRLTNLFTVFREILQNKHLPILLGELGAYSKNNTNWQLLNAKLREYVKTDSNAALIFTQDLKHKGDDIHFDSDGQRKIGERFATEYLKKFN
ncbi:sialate O-acetylesterase [Emticicia oligotrophica]|uniref:sialate O-acetylesterase n=1 Tax=Emticicia oligotrophica TaxID=312279 RepID=UPI00273C0E9B|nr:sialate O-acetylesterase [Emticicia oligotrophica]